MTEFSGWWTVEDESPAGDQVEEYTQAHLALFAAIFAACSGYEGAAPRRLDEFAISFPGTETARIGSGWAMVDGHPYENDSDEDINIPAASGGGNTRIDRIVLRADWSGFTVRLHRIEGTDAADPTAPAMTQNSGTTYDVPLYQVLVDTSGNVSEEENEIVWAAPAADGVTIEVDQETGELQVVDEGIDTEQLADDAVTAQKIGAGEVGASELADDAVTNAKIADDAVDGAKVGDRVLELYRRLGGDADDWNVPGSTSQTPEKSRIVIGAHDFGPIDGSDTAVVSFPSGSFSGEPIALATAESNVPVTCGVDTTQTQMVLSVFTHAPASSLVVYWAALGPTS